MAELTKKEALFVREYLKDLNATQAAKRCGYALHSCRQQGARLLTNADIKEAIEEALTARLDNLQIDADYVLKRLVDEVEASLDDLYDDDGSLLPVQDWPEIWKKGLVAGIEVEEIYAGDGEERTAIGRIKKIKLSDRLKRLELIGKHINVNAFQDTVEVKGLSALADRLDRAHKRMAGEGAGSEE